MKERGRDKETSFGVRVGFRVKGLVLVSEPTTGAKHQEKHTEQTAATNRRQAVREREGKKY